VISAENTAEQKWVHVDLRRCEGHGFCEEAAPELFELGDDGELVVKGTDVPAELVEKANAAVLACPVAAIKLSERRGDQ
jgi:ferredoxin